MNVEHRLVFGPILKKPGYGSTARKQPKCLKEMSIHYVKRLRYQNAFGRQYLTQFSGKILVALSVCVFIYLSHGLNIAAARINNASIFQWRWDFLWNRQWWWKLKPEKNPWTVDKIQRKSSKTIEMAMATLMVVLAIFLLLLASEKLHACFYSTSIDTQPPSFFLVRLPTFVLAFCKFNEV